MMRIFWLTICCVLVSIPNVQARDSGFNPFGMFDDMFDSDDRRDRRRHRPPPPPPPPFAGYGRPPAYGAAPAARPQAPNPPAAHTGRPGWGYQPRQPYAPAPAAPQRAGTGGSAYTAPAAPAATAETVPETSPAPAPQRPRTRASSSEKATITRGDDNEILINGRPAVFRPMNQGGE